MKEEELLRSSRLTTLGRYRMVQRVGPGGMDDTWLRAIKMSKTAF